MKTICQLVAECLEIADDPALKERLVEIKTQAEKMEDRLLKYCNAIEDLGFARIGRDYINQ
jgi:hypothetical protein